MGRLVKYLQLSGNPAWLERQAAWEKRGLLILCRAGFARSTRRFRHLCILAVLVHRLSTGAEPCCRSHRQAHFEDFMNPLRRGANHIDFFHPHFASPPFLPNGP